MSETERTSLRLSLINNLIDLLRSEHIDLVVLNEAPPLLRHRVAQEGILLYEDSPNPRIGFMVKALRDYEDTRPLRDIQAKYLLQRLVESGAAEARSTRGDDAT